MISITPEPERGKQAIRSYGDGRFRIADEVHEGSVLVFPDATHPWPVTEPEQITLDSLRPAVEAGVRVLLVGCGPFFLPIPWELKDALAAEGVVLEWMDTGAACRTFNVLLGEDREVAAALIAVK